MTAGLVLRLIAVTVLWASCFPFIVLGLDLAPHLAFAAMRAALAGACLLILGLALRRPIPQGQRAWGLIALVGFGATSMGFLGMFHAAEFVSPGLATVIANAQPLLGAILASLFLHEKLRAIGKFGLLVGFTGIIAIAWPGLMTGDVRGYSLGIAYISVAATGVAIGNVAIKRLSNDVDAVMAMGAQLLIGAIPLAVLSMTTEDLASFTWSSEFLGILLILSLFGSALVFWMWFEALKKIDLNRANAFTFLVPLFGLAINGVSNTIQNSGIRSSN